jgi:hypothetical protein
MLLGGGNSMKRGTEKKKGESVKEKDEGKIKINRVK